MILNVEIVLIVAATFLIGLCALVFRAAARRNARARALERDTEAASRKRLEKAERRSDHIVHRALSRARRLFVRSEIASIREHARESIEHRKLHALSREELEKLTEHLRAEFNTDMKAARTAHEHTLAGVEKELQTILETSRASLAEAIHTHEQFLLGFRTELTALRDSAKGTGNEILEQYARHAEEELRDLGRNAAAFIRERIDEEVRGIRSALAGYTEARQRLIDDHIVELVERTAALALTESLSLAEHARLVYRALEEARREGFFDLQETKHEKGTRSSSIRTTKKPPGA